MDASRLRTLRREECTAKACYKMAHRACCHPHAEQADSADAFQDMQRNQEAGADQEVSHAESAAAPGRPLPLAIPASLTPRRWCTATSRYPPGDLHAPAALLTPAPLHVRTP